MGKTELSCTRPNSGICLLKGEGTREEKVDVVEAGGRRPAWTTRKGSVCLRTSGNIRPLLCRPEEDNRQADCLFALQRFVGPPSSTIIT